MAPSCRGRPTRQGTDAGRLGNRRVPFLISFIIKAQRLKLPSKDTSEGRVVTLRLAPRANTHDFTARKLGFGARCRLLASVHERHAVHGTLRSHPEAADSITDRDLHAAVVMHNWKIPKILHKVKQASLSLPVLWKKMGTQITEECKSTKRTRAAGRAMVTDSGPVSLSSTSSFVCCGLLTARPQW